MKENQPLKQLVEDAKHNWDLSRLCEDLARAKQEYLFTERQQKVTPKEYHCLCGLLCYYKPLELAEILVIEAKGLRVTISSSLYKYINKLIETKTGNNVKMYWSIIPRELEKLGYRKKASPPPTLAPENQKVKFNISIDADISSLSVIKDLLRQIPENHLLNIETVERGSLVLVCETSQAGFEWLKQLHQVGELTEILGVPILDLHQITPSVNLTEWLADNFTDAVANGWLTLTEIMGERRFAFRSASVKRAKEFALGNNVKIALVVDAVRESDRSFNLIIYLYSLQPQYFLENLKLSFLEESGEILREIAAADNSNYIEQELTVEPGETIQVEIAGNDVTIRESFILP